MYGHSNPTVRSTDDGEQVGPKMHSAVQLVSNRDYPSMNALAKIIGPNGSQDYGYRIINRCKRKGLIELDADHPDATPSGRGAVVITDKGQQYLSNQE